MSIHYEVHGEGLTIVLFHGWGFDGSIWNTLLPSLNNQYQAYLVDLPGFGGTPFMSWDVFKAQLLSILPLNFSLVGWSMGGLFATRLALEESIRVSHLLNVASSPYFIKQDAWPGIESRLFNSFSQMLQRSPTRTLNQFMALQLQGQSLTTKLFKKPGIEGLKMGLDVLLSWDFRDKLHVLKMPVAYLFGRLDTIVPKRAHATMKQHYPQFKYALFERSAHAPFLSQTSEFLSFLEHFIA